MPFTPTHVAAILPVAAVARHALPFSALVIGSMVPDFPLFFPLSPSYDTTHSISGIFTACVPLGLGCLLIFQVVLKRPLIALLPDVIRRRCAFDSALWAVPTFQFVALSSLAITIGAVTHVFWDSFTHQGRWGTTLFPCLNACVFTIRGHDVAGYKALQYGSTLVLLPCLILLLFLWLSRQKPAPLNEGPDIPNSWRLAVYLACVVIPGFVTFIIWKWDRRTPYIKLGQAITCSGLALGVFLLAYSISYQVALGRACRAE